MRTTPERYPQHTAQCVYILPVNVAEVTLKEGLLEKSKLAQHAYE
jgi:hypothetical protein